MRDLNENERDVLDHLAAAARGFGALAPAHPSDRDEFVLAVHAAQNIVMARPASERYAASMAAAGELVP